MGLTFPEGRRFAFTIMDDTDVATLENVGPVYRLLDELGFRTTKTVWPVGCPEGSRNFSSSATLEDLPYLEFVQWLRSRGFEIAYHGATMETSTRERTQRAFERFRELFGGPPRVYANHSYNGENLYWGAGRLDSPVLRALYARVDQRTAGQYQGHVEGSPWWWGDLAGQMTYIRNLTFNEINLCRINPSMPYRDPRRPVVPWWFSACDAEGVHEFNQLLAPAAQDRLEAEGGVCIVATHLGKGFAPGGEVNPEARNCSSGWREARAGSFLWVSFWIGCARHGTGKWPCRANGVGCNGAGRLGLASRNISEDWALIQIEPT